MNEIRRFPRFSLAYARETMGVLGLALALACSSGGADRDRGGLTPSGSSGPSGSTGTIGQGGSIGTGGDASVIGPTGGGSIGVPEAGQHEESSTHIGDGQGLLNDSRPEVGMGVCVADAAVIGPGPWSRHCAAPTDNECDGASDINPQLKNGSFGNGYDDDCDGKVDEGCACDPAHPVGTTKTCSLVSATQVDPATGKPVGWCAINSVGTETCIPTGKEFSSVWDGQCRGAQPPFADDVCALGDFDCDGRDLNSKSQDCSCHVDVKCPTDPVVLPPFPDPNNLSPIDGSAWVGGGAANAKNWKWTVTGGDCDNILPHPTFAVYGQKVATKGGPRLSSDTPQTGLGPAANQHGFAIGPANNVGAVIYPAFGLSGDYLVKGEWDTGDGHHSCTVKVQVRSPGIRVELCWAPMPQDVDLHFARLQNPKTCTHGWFHTCSTGEDADDCYFDTDSGCLGFTGVGWGYAKSPNTACHGWSSSRTAGCDNPRLDQDNIACDPLIADPMNVDDLFGDAFCSPENINLDNPKDGDRFAVGVQYYNKGDIVGTKQAKPHVNIYCNGERRLAFGYDPTAPLNNFPALLDDGLDDHGDMWEVATIQAKVTAGALTDCIITPVHSKTPKPTKDGSKDVCVDTNPQNSATLMDNARWNFIANGGEPAQADNLCWH